MRIDILAFLKKYRFVALVFFSILVLDQATKYVVIRNLPVGSSWPEEGFFRITHVVNTGSAFGLFSGQNLILTFAALVGIGVLILFYRSHPNPTLLVRVSLGMMMAGALGNLIDRVRLGWVTDFIDIGPWYIFNVADAAIVTGVILLGASMVFQQQPEEPHPQTSEQEPRDHRLPGRAPAGGADGDADGRG